MKKFSFIIFLILGTLTATRAQVTDVTFPYNLPLTTKDGLQTIDFSGASTTGGTVSLPLFDGTGMKIASDYVKNSFSGAYFKDLEFSTDKGFVIEFIYEFYTAGVNPAMGKMGDGFALVLFDAATSNISIGANGSGLGYSYNRKPRTFQTGLSGGFLGIGFDAYGAYKNMGFPVLGDPVVDYRTGIMTYNNYTSRLFGGATTDFISIRGPVNNSTTMTSLFGGQNLAGYPLLFSQNTYNLSSTTATPVNIYLNNTWTGTEATKGERQPGNAYTAGSNTFSQFQIAGASANVTYPSANFRKVRIEMIPDVSNSKTMYINVFITTNDAQNPIKVIDKYIINLGATIRYPEMLAYKSVVSPMDDGVIRPTEMSITKPSKLKIGWTAATGEAWANIVLKDASITLPYSPVVTNDFGNICTRAGSSAVIYPLTNDYGYPSDANPTNNPTPSSSNLDLSSFRFMVPKGDGLVGYKQYSTTNPYFYENSYATYTYDKTTGSVTIVSKIAKDNNSKDVAYYDIKDKTRTDENYRSKVASITYTFLDSECKAEPTKPLANNDAVSICTLKGSTTTLSPLSNDVGYGYNTSGTLVSGNSYLDIATFTFVSATGVTITNATTASTANASYNYNTTTGVLTVTTLKAIANGTKDVLAYTVKNTGGTTASNIANITVTFDSSKCPTVLPAPTANADIINICNTISTSKTISPLSNDVGYIFNSSNAVVSGTGQYLNVSSFSFTNSSGTALADPYNTSTTNASYSYNSTTGVLTVKVLKSVKSGTSDKLYYTVANSTTTTRSTPTTITTNFLLSECAAPTQHVPLLRPVLLDYICSKEGTTKSVDAFTNCLGYVIVNNVEQSDKSDIDKTSFQFTSQTGVALSTTSPYTCNTSYANYTFNPSTGYITVTVLPNSITGQVADIVYYTVTNTTGNKNRSNTGALSTGFDPSVCPLENIWIKINAPHKGLFINGKGTLPPY